jgi:hypothetical protein
VLDAASHRWGTVHFDASSHPSTYDRRMWSADRLHPSETGHRLVAHCFAVMLRERGFPVPSLPALQPERAAPGRSAQLCWLATRGSLWLIRRLTDLVPDLVRLAAIDGWYRANGRVAELDARTDRDIAAVLATGSGQAGIAGVDTVWQRLSA